MLTALLVESNSGQLEHIQGLVNWSAYGFDVIGHCADGIAAMETILNARPDLVFINDNLPRLGGIDLIDRIHEHGIPCDFVMVSETESFAVARESMRRGVEEYLLKPVNRDELIRVLKKYIERRQSVIRQDINDRFLATKRLLRNSFIDNLTTISALEHCSMEHMNLKFNLKFRAGVFQSAIIVVKGMATDNDNDEFFTSLIINVRERFDSVCHEMIPYYLHGHFSVSFTFNYSDDNRVGEKLSELYTIAREHLEKCGFKNTVLCVGIGLPKHDFAKLKQTLETAEHAVRYGILHGQNKLYFYEKLKFDKITNFNILTPALLDDMKRSAEALDIGRFERLLRNAFSLVSRTTDPAVLIDLCQAAIAAVADACKTEDDSDDFLERKTILDRLRYETNLAGTISALVSWARVLFSKRLKECEYARPVRKAMRYVEACCTQSLSLERVAEQVHVNPSYLSTIFKKETGQNFSDYLIGCRINEAKRLLRESNLKIAQISYAVGYTDNKHFSKIFTKSVGIKASAYRALHS
ncbi:MAG: helix-turn-helix domain-containing protein [Candidatus Accumulibacter sp.]|jgi:two-component system response regulator YesN|nr:helix-turn-helix domain-containing protein [Accumulibacter sp.]